ncbi:hypothetical protein BDN70DRAFT_808509 [Pholiota conissans]|uniref:PAN2-PAN3 deadenylation complex subunit PAN3 n=1 Tax=Pholiota conissans TaxID=109636 RepID=A0A9P6CST1_9AGAR|nr:hypothetical protein BDN70DRAFT_808509 [Pholiota conissans]
MAFFSRPQSTTVRIAKPTEDDDAVKQTPPRKADSVQRQCRNVLIYGSCRFQDKGCTYYHPPVRFLPASPVPRVKSPAVTSITAQAVNAPVFVPKFAAAQRDVPSPAPQTQSTETRQAESDYASGNGLEQQDYGYNNGYDYQMDQLSSAAQGLELTDTANYYDEYHPHETSYYHAAPVFLRQPLNYLLYTPFTPPELVRNPTSSQFVPPSAELRQLLQERSETSRMVNHADLGLPDELQGYHTLVPLEPTVPAAGERERKKFGNWHSTVYKAIRTSDGVPYCLRRVEGFRLTHQAAFAPIESWSQIHHPSIVAVKEAFTTRSFNDNSLVVAYAYHPDSQTLYDLHIKSKPPSSNILTYQQPVYYGRHARQQQQQQQQLQIQMQVQLLPEQTLWSYIVQIASAIKKVHDRGLAVRMIDATKILVTGQNRVRISSCGIFDVLLFGTPQPDIAALQQEDLLKFGRLIFALCTGNLAGATQGNLQKSVESMKKGYTVEMQALALFLCSKIEKSIDQVMDMIRPRILQEHDEALMATDRLENELMGELENARLFRLMCKFGFINERPEFARDARWSETGDRYIVKLFRDYVFHQVDEHGNPVLDLSHVLTCLNKLDVGTDEKIMLVARDEQSCLVVSYKDIKMCVSSAFE